MLRVSCIGMTWFLTHMKYNRYTSHFIGLVHINLVVISTWQFVPYAYLHVTGWQMMLIYQLCLLQLLHRNDTDCSHLDLVSSRFCRSNLSCYTCPYIFCSGIDKLSSFLHVIAVFSSCTLKDWNLDPHICHGQTCSFYNSQACKQIMCSIIFRHF